MTSDPNILRKMGVSEDTIREQINAESRGRLGPLGGRGNFDWHTYSSYESSNSTTGRVNSDIPKLKNIQAISGKSRRMATVDFSIYSIRTLTEIYQLDCDKSTNNLAALVHDPFYLLWLKEDFDFEQTAKDSQLVTQILPMIIGLSGLIRSRLLNDQVKMIQCGEFVIPAKKQDIACNNLDPQFDDMKFIDYRYYIPIILPKLITFVTTGVVVDAKNNLGRIQQTTQDSALHNLVRKKLEDLVEYRMETAEEDLKYSATFDELFYLLRNQ
ncbi:MAG: hypothetical protein ACRCXZ_06470 [Patescibacteria group bacterium]